MKIATCCGINHYADTNSDLRGCLNDCSDWAAILKSRGFEVSILTELHATRSNILKNLKEQVALLKKGDTFIFTFSGHGTWMVDEDTDELDRRDEAICPSDVVHEGPISDDITYEIFSEKPTGSKAVWIADSCFSGTLSRFAPALAASDQVTRAKFLPPSVWISSAKSVEVAARSIRSPLKSKARVGALVMAGSQDSEYSYDTFLDGRDCGAFTYAALKALKELTNRPGSSSSSTLPISYLDWHRAIRKMLPSMDYPQTPMLTGTKTQKRWSILE